MKKQILLLALIILILSGCQEQAEQELVMSMAEDVNNLNSIMGSVPDYKQILDANEIKVSEDSFFREALATISPYCPLVVHGILIGGSRDGEWINASEIAGELTGSEIYSLYNMDGKLGQAVGSMVELETEDWRGPYTEQVELEYNLDIEFPTDPAYLFDNAFFAINCDSDVMPRIPVRQSLQSDIYKEIIADILAENGLNDAKVEILQNFKIDLDGDGTDEVILYAENVKEDNSTDYSSWRYDTSSGCFSILILRKIIDGEVRDFILKIDIHNREDNHDNFYVRYLFPVIGFADINGDGKMEIITTFHYYEGIGCDVYEVFDDGIELVLSNGFYV